MSTLDVFKVYARFGNFFRIHYTTGKLFRWDGDPREEIGYDKTIVFEGKVYSYEGGEGALEITLTPQILKSMITKQFALRLRNVGYRFRGDYRAYKLESQIGHTYSDFFSIFQGFEFRTVLVDESILLCIDPHIMLRINYSLGQLIQKGVPPSQLSDFSVTFSSEDERERIDGYLIEILKRESEEASFFCKIKGYRDFAEVMAPVDSVFPESRPELIQELLRKLGIEYDVVALQRQLSFLDSKTASRDRLLKTLEIVKQLQNEIFPLQFGEFKVELEAEPVVIRS